MAKKKSGSKKKKNNKLKSKASLDGDDSADELENPQDLISDKIDVEDITLPMKWLRAHQVIGVHHFAVVKPKAPGETQTETMEDIERRMKTENHARKIYTDLFYIHFANEFNNTPSDQQDAEWAVNLVKECTDKSFKTVQDLVQQSGYHLGLHPPNSFGKAPATYTEPLSTLLTDWQLTVEVPQFVASLKPALADPSTTKTAGAPGQPHSLLFDTLNPGVDAHNTMANPLRYSKDIQEIRQMLRYLKPHEAKAFLSEVVVHLMETNQAGSKQNDSFEMVKLMRSSLSKSPARTLLDEIEYNRITAPAAAKTKDQPGTVPALLDTGDYLSALQLADDLELWHRIHLLKTKNDDALKMCLDNADPLFSEPSS